MFRSKSSTHRSAEKLSKSGMDAATNFGHAYENQSCRVRRASVVTPRDMDGTRWKWPGECGNASPRKNGCLLNFVHGKLMMKWMELGELGCSHILYFKRSHMSLGKLQEFHNSQVRNRSILQRFLFTDRYSIFTLYGNSRRTKEFDVTGKGFISFAYYHEKQASIALLVAVVGRSSLEQLTLDRA